MQTRFSNLSQNTCLPHAFYNTNSRPLPNVGHGNLEQSHKGVLRSLPPKTFPLASTIPNTCDRQQQGSIDLSPLSTSGSVTVTNTYPANTDQDNYNVGNPEYIHSKNESYCFDIVVNDEGKLGRKKLGKGGCGTVYAGTRMSDYASVAIKYLSKYNVTYLETVQGRSVPREVALHL